MGRPTRRRLGIAVSAAVISAAIGVSAAFAANVDPSSVNQSVTSGTSIPVTKTVHTPAIPPKLDVVFLADTTGSMETPITNVRNNATAIMSQIQAAQPDSQFGAAEYKDFNCDTHPFKVNQGVTTNTAAVQTGINQWSADGGCDTPEAQLNALFELSANNAAGFRTGSTRVIVWFGDANGHDPSNGHSLTDAKNALVTAGVTVIAIPVNGGGNGLDNGGQATTITTATHGQLLPADPDKVADAILAGLSNLPVTVTPAPTCDGGLTATYDVPSVTVTSGHDAVFNETLAVAANAPDGGTLNCTVDFLLNGQHQDGFQQSVALTVPTRPADLALTKTASSALVTEGNTVTYKLSVTNNGSDPDTHVSATDTLQGGETFVSGDLGCTPSAGVVTCDFGTVAPGATVSMSFVAKVPLGAPSSIVNAATVKGDRPDPNPANDSGSATIQVNHNPVCTGLKAGPLLWPPNHKFQTVTVSGATDPDGNTLTTAITTVTQDEALNGLGDGDTSPDAATVAGHADQVQVRAERSGTGDGRVYRVNTSVTDGLGGSCSGTALVRVPHDQSGAAAVDSGLVVNSFGP